jgi:hypothetical protein
MKDKDYYLRLAGTVSDMELKSYYRDKAAEVSKASPEVVELTRQYVAKLRALGVDLPETVSVQVSEAS